MWLDRIDDRPKLDLLEERKRGWVTTFLSQTPGRSRF